jgi:hypothetical protein
MRTSEAINEISLDLSKAQAVIVNPAKDGNNPHFRSKYATLDTGLNIVRECMSKHNISVVQATRVEGNVLMLDTRLAHKSGQWIEAEYPVCAFPAKQQEMGSALTYSRRYSLFSLVGIAGEEDDDGNAAVTATQAPKREKPSELTATQSSEVLKDLTETLKKCVSNTALLEWADANRSKTENLTKVDKTTIGQEYTNMEAKLKTGKAA